MSKYANTIANTGKKVSLAAFIATLASCTGVNGDLDLTKPTSLDINPPNGPYNYRKGWMDGCRTGIASTNTDFHLTVGIHKFIMDKKIKDDPLYRLSWGYGFNHCGYSMKALALYDNF